MRRVIPHYLKEVLRQPLTTVAVLTTLFAVAVGAWRVSMWASPSSVHQPRFVEDWLRYSEQGSPLAAHEPVVRIVVFSDYACGHCSAALSTVDTLVRQFRGAIEVVWRHFPMLGEGSRAAALAAICARGAGGGMALHSQLFLKYDSLVAVGWGKVAEELAVHDAASFIGCLSSEAAMKALERDVVAARELGLSGVPGVLLDSLLFIGMPPQRYLQTHINLAMKKSAR
jgi:protein-disulfide isomerase